MAFVFKNIPVEFKDLPKKEKEKAIEIAANFIDKGVPEKEAINCAVKQAAQWGLDSQA